MQEQVTFVTEETDCTYDFVWFAGRRTPVNLRHLEQRMRQSGDWGESGPLTEAAFRTILRRHIDSVNIHQAKEDVVRFLPVPGAVAVWSKDFFMEVAEVCLMLGFM